MEKESKAEHFLKGLSEHSEIFDLNISPEYTERQLLLFAEMYHKHEQNRKAAMINPPNLDDTLTNKKK